MKRPPGRVVFAIVLLVAGYIWDGPAGADLTPEAGGGRMQTPTMRSAWVQLGVDYDIQPGEDSSLALRFAKEPKLKVRRN